MTQVLTESPRAQPARVTFVSRDSARFLADLKREVAAYFSDRGLSQKADGMMIAKTVIMLGLVFVPYALIMTNAFTPWQMLGLAVVMGVGVAGIGFAVSHDALHGAYSDSPRTNKLIGMTFDLLGANGYMWQITHNVIHHTYTNIHGVDEDLEVSPLLRLSPHSEHRPFHRFQHLYAFLAYSFSTLFWVFVKDYKYFMQRDLGPYQNKKHPPQEIARLVIGKLVYYGWAIALPLVVLDVAWWQFAIGFLTMHLVGGLILGVVFQLAHVVEGTTHPTPDVEGMMEQAWIVHEMETTSNFAPRSRLLSWYVGGLNFQVEHHLFPKVCSVHYPAINTIVKDVAARYGVQYNEQPTLMAAIRSHYRMLKTLGSGATGLPA